MDSFDFPFGSYTGRPADLDYCLVCPFGILPSFQFTKASVAGYTPFTGTRQELETKRWWSREQACKDGWSQGLYLLDRIRKMTSACPEVYVLDRFVCGLDHARLCRMCTQINSVINFHYCGHMNTPGACAYCDDPRERQGSRLVSIPRSQSKGAGVTPGATGICTDGNVCSVLEALCLCRKEQVKHLADLKTSEANHCPCIIVLPISEVLPAGYNNLANLHQTVVVIDYRPVVKLSATSTALGAVTTSSTVRMIYYDPHDYSKSDEVPVLSDEVRLLAGLFGVQKIDLVIGQQIGQDELCVGHALWAIYRLVQGQIPGDHNMYGVSFL